MHMQPSGFARCRSTGFGLHVVLLALLALASPVHAEQMERVGDYEIHYSAINTAFLTPEVADAYDITRSQVQALLNVSVLKRQPDGSTRAVNAMVNGNVGNLAGQTSPLAFRTVREGDAIYQLATFRIIEGEPMRFSLMVTYDPDQPPAEVAFIQRFYSD
ncbi:DUF4426 domain-containing protein [Halomonas shantousis]